MFSLVRLQHLLKEPLLADRSAAYSITSAYTSNGLCVTTSGPPIQVSPAYSETLTSANGRVTLDVKDQQSFIDFLGFSTCSGGGENVIATALIQVQNTTMTTTSSFTNVPLAAAVASLTIAPVSSLCRKGRYCFQMCSSAQWTLSRMLQPKVFFNETICANDYLSSNLLPLQHQEPPRPTHRPRSSPQSVVSNISTFSLSSPL